MPQPDVYLGVLCARRSSKTRPYQEQTTFFRRLIREAKAIGVEVYIFSPRDILWKRRRIRGWTLENGRWRRRLYRFPDAVFDRVSPKGKADLSGVPAVRRRLKRLGIPRFNTRLPGKWGMYKLWRKYPELLPALPPTRVLSKSTLKAMLNRYGEVYVKPIQGGQGKGVAWIKRVRGGYRYRIHGPRGSRSGKVASIAAVSARCCGGRPRIVQMAIDVLKCDGRPFDIRALVQRHADGDWHVTGVVARVGGRKSKVTNIHAGGSARKVREALAEAGADEATIDEVIRKVEHLALATARACSQATPLVAELGVDFAVDKEYNCWLLEANSRTGRISFHRAGETEAAAQADRSPAEFARFLAMQKAAEGASRKLNRAGLPRTAGADVPGPDAAERAAKGAVEPGIAVPAAGGG